MKGDYAFTDIGRFDNDTEQGQQQQQQQSRRVINENRSPESLGGDLVSSSGLNDTMIVRST